MTAKLAIDLDHLNRYTAGDRALNEEILQLFENQCVAMLARLEALAWEGRANGKDWRELAHGLKGAARGVGAFALADVAAEAEKIPPDKAVAVEIVHRLKSNSDAVRAFVEQMLRD
jgi:HPt (histidine-containing phosphotransfer) domain-containing protein